MKMFNYMLAFAASFLLTHHRLHRSGWEVTLTRPTGRRRAELQSLNGAYSRILTVGDYLYAVDQTNIITYDIVNRDNPQEVGPQRNRPRRRNHLPPRGQSLHWLA